MAKNIFLISDTHFGHGNMLNFFRADGVTKVRSFDSVEDMDETMVKNWNSVVKPHDKVYHLGDVVINKKCLPIMYRLNGDKILIKGNHDIFDLKEYSPHFRDIRGYHVLDGMIMSHIPIHPGSVGRFGSNIHGHTHENRVMDSRDKIDPKYFPVCVEHHDYTPVAYEDVRKMIVAQGGVTGFNKREGDRAAM